MASIYRTEESTKIYEKKTLELRKKGICVFCNIDDNDVISVEPYFYIAKNTFPYDFWDKKDVEDHLLVIPHRHITGLEDAAPEAADEYFEILQKYQGQGYDVFTRSNQSVIKSQPHLHTHLIKTKEVKII